MDRNRLLQRFLNYVRINTTANDQTTDYPSSPGQLTLGQQLASELRAMGLTNVNHDGHGIVIATIPASPGCTGPAICFNAHLDTSPETSGANVQPQVISDYRGGDIQLRGAGGLVISVAQCPELNTVHGHTLITTDGTTLLGGDDKAGVAIIMELAEHLCEHPEIAHGPVRVLFTCDEEIGRGAMHVDLSVVDAQAAYTFDGGCRNLVDHETFSADLATVTVHGVNIHPSIGKGKMVNAVRIASALIDRLPRAQSPEQTCDRQGFLHPYTIEGGVAKAEIRILLRDFAASQLVEQAELIRTTAQQVEREFPGSRIEVAVRKQYRNMAEGLAREPRALQFALDAHRQLGREPQLTIIRGGTDGSQFTEMGLPTPNLSSGQHNIHSPLEWASLDEMLAACEVGVEIVKCWGRVS